MADETREGRARRREAGGVDGVINEIITGKKRFERKSCLG
jgi:hypothetical protein